QLEGLESDARLQAAADDEPVLLAIVAQRPPRVGGVPAGLVDHLEEVDPVIRARRQPLPPHPAGQIDGPPPPRPLHHAVPLRLAGPRPVPRPARPGPGHWEAPAAIGGREHRTPPARRPNQKSSDARSSVAIAYKIPTEGADSPRSICEIRLGEQLIRRPSSLTDSPRSSRTLRSRGPSSAPGSNATSRSAPFIPHPPSSKPRD